MEMETVPQEYTYLYEKLFDKEWEFCVPDYEKIYKISCFDDGMDKYKDYPNEWIVFGKWKGKTALVNAVFNNLIIDSISTWKIDSL